MVSDPRRFDELSKADLADIQAVNSGRKTLKDTALPPGTRLEGGRVIPPETGVAAFLIIAGIILSYFGLIAMIGLGISLTFAAIRAGLFYKVNGNPVYLFIIGCFCMLSAGYAFWFLRDVKQWRLVAISHIALGVVGGVAAYFMLTDFINSIISICFAVIAVADGIGKIKSFQKESDH